MYFLFIMTGFTEKGGVCWGFLSGFALSGLMDGFLACFTYTFDTLARNRLSLELQGLAWGQVGAYDAYASAGLPSVGLHFLI